MIQKTEDVVEREIVISQKNTLYEELKTCLGRQPGIEIVEELRQSKEVVKSKLRECKVCHNIRISNSSLWLQS